MFISVARETINAVLVTLFQQIMRIEERKLKSFGSDLTVKEAHVIEAVVQSSDNNTMSQVANRLKVTMGSLTVAVSTLEKKGYLCREQSTTDKRKVHITPTLKALKVNMLHEQFHKDMTDRAMDALNDQQLTVLVSALKGIHTFFDHEEEEP